MNDVKSNSETNFIGKTWIIVAIVTLVIITLLILEATFSVFLLIFAGILIAVFLCGLSGLIQRKTKWKENICVALSILITFIFITGFFWLVGTKIQSQANELVETLPATLQKARTELSKSSIGEMFLNKITSEETTLKLQQFAASFFKSTFGVLGDVYVVVFIGLFITVSPNTYIDGAVSLIPSSGQKKAQEVFKDLGEQLRKWIKGKLLSMFIVFILTAVGLAILNVPLWLVLALLAGILSFIPNFGPILGLIPAALVGLMQGNATALWIIGLYALIQFVESNFITTLIQQKMVNMPPALIISSQMILGGLTGSWGLILSTPLTVVVILLVKELYIKPRDQRIAE